MRHLILVVTAVDDDGDTLELISGSTIPTWCGEGDRDEGYYAGAPGTVYAKVLQELWTQVTPTAAYWNHTRLISDNRIAAMESATSEYTFSPPTVGTANISVKLVFRKAFIGLIDQKGWDMQDLILAEQTLVLQ